jgi:inhibitor of KinA
MISWQPLGDQAVLASCPDEAAAGRLAATVKTLAAPWLVDVVQAYASVAVFFDPDQVFFAEVVAALPTLPSQDVGPAPNPAQLHPIPCCYEMQQDMERVMQHTGLSTEEVIRLHTGTVFTVYAIGFCPGFPYLGYLPPPLCGVPRLATPRLRVEAGSIGLTGRQTGIYTEVRPGGWNLIGRTPLQLVHVTDGYFPLRTGDRVQFYRIDEGAYRGLVGQRL